MILSADFSLVGLENSHTDRLGVLPTSPLHTHTPEQVNHTVQLASR